MEGMVFVLIAVAAFFVFWLFQFVQLMMFADNDFPDRYDKILWCISFHTLFFVAPFGFLFWKRAYLLSLSDIRPRRANNDYGAWGKWITS